MHEPVISVDFVDLGSLLRLQMWNSTCSFESCIDESLE